MHNVTAAMLLLIGVVAIGFSLIIALALRPVRRAQLSPMKSPEMLKSHAVGTIADAPRRPTLSPTGQVAALFARAFGLLGLGVTWATLHRLIEDYYAHSLPPTAFVAVLVLAPTLIDGVAVFLLLKLWRHYLLAERGRLTSGILVAYGISGKPRLGQLIPTVYDFSPGSGAVLRGTGILSSYSWASPFFETSVGCGVDVLYLPDNPRCNGLRLALFWAV